MNLCSLRKWCWIFAICFFGCKAVQVVYPAATTVASDDASRVAAPPVFAVPGGRLMGCEIETRAIKVDSPGAETLGFTISGPVGDRGLKELWQIEDDTTDPSLAGTASARFNRNLECKTVGGWGYDELLTLGEVIQKLLEHLYAVHNTIIDIPYLHGRYPPPYAVTPYAGTVRMELIGLMSTGREPYITPQITYQLPLGLIHEVFMRLDALGDEAVGDFINLMNPDVEITGLNDLETQLRTRLVPPLFDPPNQEVLSFCFLFAYYWHQIFNNAVVEAGEVLRTPGLKRYLHIMLRVPFPQIYQSLPDVIQAQIRGILEPIITDVGRQFRMREYVDYNGTHVRPNITLEDWYRSVIDPTTRGVRGKDFLSPPPGSDGQPMDGDAMGKYDIATSSNLPLIEVRGYGIIRSGGNRPRIGEIEAFLKREAEWFFKGM